MSQAVKYDSMMQTSWFKKKNTSKKGWLLETSRWYHPPVWCMADADTRELRQRCYVTHGGCLPAEPWTPGLVRRCIPKMGIFQPALLGQTGGYVLSKMMLSILRFYISSFFLWFLSRHTRPFFSKLTKHMRLKSLRCESAAKAFFSKARRDCSLDTPPHLSGCSSPSGRV